MCLLILLALAIYSLVVVFFATAQILLPWTISATVVAGLAGLGISKLMDPSSPFRAAACGVSTLLLTMALGYLGFLLIPPTPPPPRPPVGLVELMTELPKPDISHDDLMTMLPIHLAIAGCIGMLLVSLIVIGQDRKRES